MGFSPWWCFAAPGVSSSHRGHKVFKFCPFSNDLVQRGEVFIIVSILQVLGTLQVLWGRKRDNNKEGKIRYCNSRLLKYMPVKSIMLYSMIVYMYLAIH
jgi:hypothetical protein